MGDFFPAGSLLDCGTSLLLYLPRKGGVGVGDFLDSEGVPALDGGVHGHLQDLEVATEGVRLVGHFEDAGLVEDAGDLFEGEGVDASAFDAAGHFSQNDGDRGYVDVRMAGFDVSLGEMQEKRAVLGYGRLYLVVDVALPYRDEVGSLLDADDEGIEEPESVLLFHTSSSCLA